MASVQDTRRRRRGFQTDSEGRLAPGLSLLLIALLSALSWAVLIGIVMALRVAL